MPSHCNPSVLGLSLSVLSFSVIVSSSLPLLTVPDPLYLGGRTFKLQDEIVGSQFYDAFNFETFNDPTHGRVK
jgi:hypothetical protein